MIKTSYKIFFVIILFLGILLPTENDLDEYLIYIKKYLKHLQKITLIHLIKQN